MAYIELKQPKKIFIFIPTSFLILLLIAISLLTIEDNFLKRLTFGTEVTYTIAKSFLFETRKKNFENKRDH